MIDLRVPERRPLPAPAPRGAARHLVASCARRAEPPPARPARATSCCARRRRAGRRRVRRHADLAAQLATDSRGSVARPSIESAHREASADPGAAGPRRGHRGDDAVRVLWRHQVLGDGGAPPPLWPSSGADRGLPGRRAACGALGMRPARGFTSRAPGGGASSTSRRPAERCGDPKRPAASTPWPAGSGRIRRTCAWRARRDCGPACIGWRCGWRGLADDLAVQPARLIQVHTSSTEASPARPARLQLGPATSTARTARRRGAPCRAPWTGGCEPGTHGRPPMSVSRTLLRYSRGRSARGRLRSMADPTAERVDTVRPWPPMRPARRACPRTRSSGSRRCS